MASLIEELQTQALDHSIPVEDLLRRAKVIAEKIGDSKMSKWIDRELNGYGPDDEYPEYRKIQSEFQAFNPYQGWVPVIFDKPEEVKWLFERRRVNNPAGQVGKVPEGKEVAFTIRPNIKSHLVRSIDFASDVRCILNRSEVLAIPEIVRNRVLDWSLRLEKVSTALDRPSMTTLSDEGNRAITINVHGNVANLSSVGDVAAGAVITTQQSGGPDFDPRALQDLSDQLRKHLGSLVHEVHRSQLVTEIEVVEGELKTPTPNVGKIRGALLAVEAMLRDATINGGGSLIQAGAMMLIAEVLKHL